MDKYFICLPTCHKLTYENLEYVNVLFNYLPNYYPKISWSKYMALKSSTGIVKNETIKSNESSNYVKFSSHFVDNNMTSIGKKVAVI